ncbi:MAG: polyribonucleotide nucleotidyltransferase [Armatimonadota bacterium]|nr:polyribonucleotide nucleotidyltransferase [Armatimonadota bacterium]
MTVKSVEIELDGKTILLETGRVAGQANGAVIATCSDTVVIATACMSSAPREGINFFPLICDYEERKYAVGRIPGGFIKRGGRPSEKAILTSRLIDRPIRPLFPEGMRNDVQVIAMPLSMEPDVPADTIALVAASAALAVSDIPWNGPIGGVRVCRVGGEFIVNPSLDQIKESDMELIVAGLDGKTMEIELEADQVAESDLMTALDVAHSAINKQIEGIKRLVEIAGKPKADVPLITVDTVFLEEIDAQVGDRIDEAIRNPGEAGGKSSAAYLLKEELAVSLAAEYPERQPEIDEILEKLFKKHVRRLVLEEGARPDGRAQDEIRPVSCEVGLLPRVHGSGLFVRGQTQVLTTLTLGSLDESQIVDTLEEDGLKRFMHFYNFPPFSTGEVAPLRAPGRREVGHGALAEKALRPMIPPQEEFPYALLLTSEVLESAGSTSMAATCGCSLALMDAGVKIKAPVAGISIGMVSDENRRVLLTDIADWEDFYGDMDFKVAGTRQGVTAIQVDTKIQGLDREVIREALEKAREARLQILDIMAETIPEPRPSLSPYAPRVLVIEIHPDKIGDVIGPGGKVVKKIEAETGAKLYVEQDGHVYITASDFESAERAKKIVDDLTKEVRVGEVYTGRVTRVEPFGAFVEILPGREGLVHISQLAKERVNKTEDICKVGDEILVKVIEIGEDGKIRLTRRGLLEDLESAVSGGRRESGDKGRGGPSSASRDRGTKPREQHGRGFDDEAPKFKFRPKR